MSTKDDDRAHRWASLRWAVVGPIVSSPPPKGTLEAEIDELTKILWRHPIRTDEWVSFCFSTIERWYYRCRSEFNPIDHLRRKIRSDAGHSRVITAACLAALESQYKQHVRWSYQLHTDNLSALVKQNPHLGSIPSYTTVRRHMKQRGWIKRKSSRGKKTDGMRRAEQRLEAREVRSYEVGYVHELWHFDYHTGRRQVVLPNGTWHTPELLCIIDDYSRWVCHAQWYLHEDTETLTHGHHQAYLKRGLPRSELSDNGSAMRAEETRNGFEGLSIQHERTLDYSPYQNAKQEVFWHTQIEGRLMPMLEDVEPLTLDFLNFTTQAFIEQDYHRRRHDELGCTPLQRALEGKSAGRPSPEIKHLRFVFTVKKKRRQRRSDGTVSIAGVRFEVPNHLRTMDTFWVRYQRWDLSLAYVVDPRDHRQILAIIYPLDKLRNANRRRKALCPVDVNTPAALTGPQEITSPLMRQILTDYTQSGLPPAYIPLESALTDATTTKEEDNNDND